MKKSVFFLALLALVSVIYSNSFAQVPCPSSIAPTSRTFDSAGGTGSVSVTAGSSCYWDASSDAGWLTITSGYYGHGSGTIYYSVSANPGPGSRTAHITVSQEIPMDPEGPGRSDPLAIKPNGPVPTAPTEGVP